MNEETKPIESEVDELKIKIYPDRQIMGMHAAYEVGNKLRTLLEKQDFVRIIFAAAPSQNELLRFLSEQKGIDWTRVIAFHMDEYLELNGKAPQLFGNYLKENIFSKVNFRKIYYINSNPDNSEKECARYACLLKEAPIDIVCMGIGENGHIAFNDPDVTDFTDPVSVKIVRLDNISRQQQVNDGCFASLNMVPAEAITLTIPALMSGRFLFVVVPGPTKSNAIFKVVKDKITTGCPATILRKHKGSILYLDMEAASKII